MKALWFLLPLSLLGATPAGAEVAEASAAGFTTIDRIVAKAPAEQVWTALIDPARWWSGAHTWSGDAANLTLEPRAGGCFCEKLAGAGSFPEGSVLHMTVIHAAPVRLLRMSGALGPLQGEALNGTLSISLEPVEGGTSIEWAYVVGGHARFPLERIAPGVDGVMTEQMSRLASLFEAEEPAAR